tara:strand:- start:1454 stop:1816 length:363 start_codon:yes stop_codon:yes gene_type:complete
MIADCVKPSSFPRKEEVLVKIQKEENMNSKLKYDYLETIKVLTRDGIKVCYKTERPRIFNTWLIDEFDLPDTRAPKFGKAIDALHDAICRMDEEYQEKIFNTPIKELINKFAELEELRKL